MAGLKLNLKDAILLKTNRQYIWEASGKSSSGVSFSWISPMVFVVDSSVSQSLSVRFLDFALPAPVTLHNALINWGDGTSTSVSAAGTYSHTYPTNTNTYEVKIIGVTSGFIRVVNNSVTVVKNYGHLGQGILTLESTNVSSVPLAISPKLTTLAVAFEGCSSLNDANIVSWDVSRITSIEGMFYGTPFNRNISSWDTSSVTQMATAFDNATSFNQNISSWNTSNVTNMSAMFRGASAFNQNLGSLPINNVTTMSEMFNSSGMSTENYSRTLIGWANQHFAGNAKNNVPLGASGKTYNNTAYTTGNQFNDAVAARAYLVGTAGWTITDGGQV